MQWDYPQQAQRSFVALVPVEPKRTGLDENDDDDVFVCVDNVAAVGGEDGQWVLKQQEVTCNTNHRNATNCSCKLKKATRHILQLLRRTPIQEKL